MFCVFFQDYTEDFTLYGGVGKFYDMCKLDNDLLASGDESGNLDIWNTKLGSLQKRISTTFQSRLARLDDNSLASTDKANNIIIWNLSDFSIKYTLIGHQRWIWALAKLDNGLLASGGDDHKVIIWNVTTGSLVHELVGHDASVSSLCYLDNSLLASGDALGSIIVWDLGTSTAKLVLRSDYGWWWNGIGTIIKLDQNLLANTNYHTVNIWNFTSGRLVLNLTSHTNYVTRLAYLDSNLLASGGDDNSTKLWKVNTGELKYTLANYSGGISSLIKLDNDLLAGSSSDGTIKIWNVISGQLRFILNGLSAVWKAVRLDGNSLASGHTGYIKIWGARNGRIFILRFEKDQI